MSTQPYTLLPLTANRTKVEQSITHSQTKVKEKLIKKETAAEKILNAFPELIPGENKVDKGISKAVEPSFNPSIGKLLTEPEKVGENLGKQAKAEITKGLFGNIFGGAEHGLVRIGKVLAGAIIIMFGLYLLVKILSPAAASATVTGAGKGARAAAPHVKNAALAAGYAVQPR